MLILSRKKFERVIVHGPCEVVVLSIHGDKVRLGFKADPAVVIHRAEVQAQIDREKDRETGD